MASDVDDTYGLSEAMPGCKLHLARAPKAQGARFDVVLDHSEGSRYGCKLVRDTHGTKIHELESDGLLEQWNVKHPQRKVKAGDVVVSVNGVTGHEDMWREREKRQVMKMTLLRAASTAGHLVDHGRDVDH